MNDIELLCALLVRLIEDKAATSDRLQVLADLLTEADIDVGALRPEGQQVFQNVIGQLLGPAAVKD